MIDLNACGCVVIGLNVCGRVAIDLNVWAVVIDGFLVSVCVS